MLKVTWTRSQICCKQQHRRTLKALGFTKLNQTIFVEDTKPLRGMLDDIYFLLEVSEATDKDINAKAKKREEKAKYKPIITPKAAKAE